jgi:polyphenol oxidase
MIELELPGARAAFSTRAGGVSEGPYASLNVGLLTGDDPERVVENRLLLAAAVGLDPAAIALGHQVHGTAIERWGAAPDPVRHGFGRTGTELPDVDGHTTARHGLGLLVQVADCLPVALASERRVAMIHCGWRGLAAGIVAHALTLFESPPAAAVGPGIGPCCYEVGAEVLAAFDDVDGAADGRMLDLRRIAEARLREGGVESVEHVDLCTSCRDDLFFSHRRDGGVTGRQCGIVWRP